MSRLQNPPVLCFGHGFFTLLSKQIVSEFYCIRPLAASQEAEYQILTHSKFFSQRSFASTLPK